MYIRVDRSNVLDLEWNEANARASRNICYDDLGCISIDRSWYDLTYRPINARPLPRETVNTNFTLYTRETIHQHTKVNIDFIHCFPSVATDQ